MSLIDICYEQIKDNFWYGLFGDFKLIIDKEKGYFNATKLCASGGKRFIDWKRLEGSQSLISYYDNLVHADLRIQKSVYTITPKGRNSADLLTLGTYVREELILNIATWISHDF